MVNKTDLDDKVSPGTPLDPVVIAAMANSLGYEPEVNDPMTKQVVSAEPPEAQALEALPAINESQAVEWQRPKHLHTIQEWADQPLARLGLIGSAVFVVILGLYFYVSKSTPPSSPVVSKDTPPSTEPIDPLAEKVAQAERDKAVAETRSALGDQSNSLTNSKVSSPASQLSPAPTAVSGTPVVTASPGSSPQPAVTIAPTTPPKIITSVAVPAVTTATVARSNRPIHQAPIAAQALKPTVIQPVSIANLGSISAPQQPPVRTRINRSTSQEMSDAARQVQAWQPRVRQMPVNQAPPAMIANLGNLENRLKKLEQRAAVRPVVKPNNQRQIPPNAIASLGRIQPEPSRSLPPVVNNVAITPQDLGSVGSIGAVVPNQQPAPAVLASNVGVNSAPVGDRDVNRSWGLNKVGDNPNSPQPVSTPGARPVGIYAPPPVTDYFRDTAAGNSIAPTVVAQNPMASTKDLPKVSVRMAFVPEQNQSVSPPPPLLAPTPAQIAQGEANRLFSVGTAARALTLTPIIYGNKTQSIVPKYEIVLTEALQDKVSHAGFPAGTRLIVSPNAAASDMGEIQLDVVSIKLSNNQEFTPPSGAIVVRAEDGGLLIGEDYFRRSDQVAGRNLNRIILGGLSTLGQNANRPNVSFSSVLGGGVSTTTTSTTNTEPNFWLSLLEGSAKEGLSIVTEENQNAIKEALSAPKVFKLRQNLKVQVYTNSTIAF